MIFNTIMYQEGDFSIRSGRKRYFIMHDPCDSENKELRHRPGVAHDTKYDGTVIHSGACRTCGKEYSNEMSGFIQLLNWEN